MRGSAFDEAVVAGYNAAVAGYNIAVAWGERGAPGSEGGAPGIGVVVVGSALPRLHVVTDDRILARPGFLMAAAQVLEAGGARVTLHLRGPHAPGRALHEAGAALLGPARRAGASLTVNDRADIALALGIRRVHLGARSLPARVVRTLFGRAAARDATGKHTGAQRSSARTLRPERGSVRLGRSVHRSGEAREEESEIDYLFVGTVFSTPSHPGVVPQGPRVVRSVTATSALPVVGIGGIGPRQVAGVLGAGAWGVAAIRAVWDARTPGDGVERFLAELPSE